MADFVKDVVKVAAPVVGGIFGGPGGAMAGAAVSGIIGADESRDAATSAAGQYASATDQATQLQRDIYNQTRADQAPWRMAGQNALAQLSGMTSGPDAYLLDTYDWNPFKYTEDPGYDFRFNEGMRGINASAAARGGMQSGAALKAAARYGQEMGSQEYNNAFNRWRATEGDAYNRFNTDRSNIYNRLAGISGTGQVANNALQQAGTQYASNVGTLGLNNAAVQGNAGIANANTNASMYSGLGNLAGRYFSQPSAGNSNFLSSMYGGSGMMGSGLGASVGGFFGGYEPLDYSGYNAVADYIDF